VRRGLTRFWSHDGRLPFKISGLQFLPNTPPRGTGRNLTKQDLGSRRIDQIVSQAEEQGSLAVAISGLNSIRHTLDSLMRLAGYDRPIGSQVNVAVQTNVNIDLSRITERLIQHFDNEPELKARIAQALLEIDDDQAA